MFPNNGSNMDLKDALGGGGPSWPGQPTNPMWPGQPSPSHAWSGGSFGGGGGMSRSNFPGPAGPGPRTGPPAVPYHEKLSSGVYDRLLITIAGSINANANKITVDLSTDQSDLAFHFNPRFNENGEQVIVRNSLINQKWGPEERQLDFFPFIPGNPFEIKIFCTNSEYKVAVNNSHLLTYQHRIRDLSSIKNISIYNDLTLSAVNFETLP